MKRRFLFVLVFVSTTIGFIAGNQMVFAAREALKAECGCKEECKCNPCRCAFSSNYGK